MDDKTLNKIFERISGPMNELIAVHVTLNDDKLFGATLCQMVDVYCKAVKQFKGREVDANRLINVIAIAMRNHTEEEK